MMSHRYKFTLDDEAKKFCEEILNETDDSREKALKELREWAKENATLHVRTDVEALLPFLRGNKFDLEKTKIKLTNYYTLRRDAPEWFINRNPRLPEIQDLVKLGVFIPLKTTHNNQLVVIIRTSVHNPKVHKQDDVFKTGKMVLDIAARENELAQIYGVTAIFDMTGVSLAHARQLTPGIIKKAVFAWQNYHCRPQKLEFINAPMYINVVLNVFKSFMSDKLKGRVQVHFKGLQSLHKLVPKELLPREYGGGGESLKDINKYWYDKLVENADWFAEDERFRAD